MFLMTPGQDGPPEVEIVAANVERLGEVESLWQAMYAHDAEVAERAREVVPFRQSSDAWPRRRREFERRMAAGEAWLLIAEREGAPVGFALFCIAEGDWSFATDDRIGELEALSVVPELRRWGIGSLLMEEVERRLVAQGIDYIGLSLVAGNTDALHFYERWGMAPAHVRCLGRTLRRGT